MKEVYIRQINTELTTFDIFSLFKNEEEVVFLDSGKDFSGSGRYSFLGINPFIKIKGDTKEYVFNGEAANGDVLDKIKDILQDYKIENNTNFPFIGGGIGYFSYDLGRDFEKITEIAKEDIEIPKIYFNFYDNVIIFDNLNKTTFVTGLGIKEKAEKSIDEIESIIKSGETIEKPEVGEEIDFTKFTSNFEKEEYIKAVGKVRDYIRSGDVYIMNLTQRFQCPVGRSGYDIYNDLRTINPAQFGAYMKLDEFEILSCSPERFLKVREGVIDTRPIKGTRPRGKNPEEDEKNRKELMNSEKDKSELLMIVDLERNDLSRVCKLNTVKVTELFEIEEYPTVFHLVSNIRGELEEGKDIIDSIRVAFPGGSITGAPKIRAMEIIDEMEKVRRNIYTGSIGYLGFDGNCDINIVIRTIMLKEGTAYFGVGGGITWESEEEFEYEETLHKAKALMRALCNE
ncbi:aminodeoxychorismate synthase component I [Oceanirhabdus sp. W0125-5]|uniref:aminodeoxychorismate synthase component I n=1 Tax=Oceanirhabdus sp. W0125-5 TaxID=2999116 RepID=UPI0022F32DED|nr:aminodeoxychorismate synthase component I [Oceanirhabdus sp. W0125-5]WBW96000.1 aminodeoxychorismate synthase component I [Oceanirhabdus sp. W0125-5]